MCVKREVTEGIRRNRQIWKGGARRNGASYTYGPGNTIGKRK